MSLEELYDISNVCAMLNTTSRTLRFYEEEGLIKSKKIFSNRRRYNNEDIELIKKILVLRSLGLSINKIKEIQKGDSDLKQAIVQHKAEIIAKIQKRAKEIQLLDEALNTLELGGSIYAKNETDPSVRNELISRATEYFVNNQLDKLFNAFSDMLKSYLPLTALETIVEDSKSSLGNFVCIEKTEQERYNDKIFYVYLRYQRLGLRIKYVILSERINGFWLTYYEI